MPVRYLAMLVAFAALHAGDKKPPVRAAENDAVQISATVLADKDAVRQALGTDLGGHYVVVEIRLNPKDGKRIAVHRDDFVLRTDKDGEKATPFAPSQIAGRGALIVSQTGAGAGIFSEDRGPIVGGGPVPMGQPRRLGGEGGTIGGGGQAATQATVRSGAREKEDPLIEVLKAKALPEKETDAPLSGLLYFPMEKQKLKDLELIYRGPDGKLSVRFR